MGGAKEASPAILQRKRNVWTCIRLQARPCTCSCEIATVGHKQVYLVAAATKTRRFAVSLFRGAISWPFSNPCIIIPFMDVGRPKGHAASGISRLFNLAQWEIKVSIPPLPRSTYDLPKPTHPNPAMGRVHPQALHMGKPPSLWLVYAQVVTVLSADQRPVLPAGHLREQAARRPGNVHAVRRHASLQVP